jgi:enoyl-CoA hydratase/carnithine racemase
MSSQLLQLISHNILILPSKLSKFPLNLVLHSHRLAMEQKDSAQQVWTLLALVLIKRLSMTAREALAFGFVAHVYQDEKEVWDKLKQIENLPLGSIIANKKLTRKFSVDELEKANLSEFEELEKRMVTEEAFLAMLNFQESRKNKSKL